MPAGIYKRTLEHGLHISQSRKGHIVSSETRQKISSSLIGKKLAQNTLDKMRSKIKYTIDANGCWLCTSHKPNNKGYIRLNRGEKSFLLHRSMYEEKYGKIPDGYCACHKCDTRNCINPDHIFIGTVADNNHDRDAKGRGVIPHCKKGVLKNGY